MLFSRSIIICRPFYGWYTPIYSMELDVPWNIPWICMTIVNYQNFHHSENNITFYKHFSSLPSPYNKYIRLANNNYGFLWHISTYHVNSLVTGMPLHIFHFYHLSSPLILNKQFFYSQLGKSELILKYNTFPCSYNILLQFIISRIITS